MQQYHLPLYLKEVKSSKFLESRTCVSAFVGKLLVKIGLPEYSDLSDGCMQFKNPEQCGHFSLLSSTVIGNKEKIRCKFYFIAGREKQHY